MPQGGARGQNLVLYENSKSSAGGILKIRNFCKGFVRIKSSRSGETTLSFTQEGKS